MPIYAEAFVIPLWVVVAAGVVVVGGVVMALYLFSRRE